MKSYHLTVYSIIALFVVVMGVVVTVAFKRTSNSTGVDPAQIKHIRDMAQK